MVHPLIPGIGSHQEPTGWRESLRGPMGHQEPIEEDRGVVEGSVQSLSGPYRSPMGGVNARNVLSVMLCTLGYEPFEPPLS